MQQNAQLQDAVQNYSTAYIINT